MIPLRDSVRPRTIPVLNWILIGVNLLVFMHQIGLPDDHLERLYYSYGIVPQQVFLQLESGAAVAAILQPFITAMFIHGGWLHVLSNMLYLWVFGDNIEDRLGHFRYLIFYLLAGTIGSIAHVLSDPYSAVPVIGASGAVAGVLGGYLILFPRSRILALVPIFFFLTLTEVPALIFLVFWFVLQLFSGVASLGGYVNPVAWWAHIGGFIAGMVLVKIFALGRPVKKDRQIFY